MNKKNCERCGVSLQGIGHTTSKLNTETICINCKEAERKMRIYDFADKIEMQEVRKGNLNFEGVLNHKDYCLMECYLTVEDVKRHFKFIGKPYIKRTIVSLPRNSHDYGEGYDTLKYDDVYIMELTDGKWNEYNITAKTWAGQPIDAFDAMADVISRYSRKAVDFELVSCHDLLEKEIEKLKDAGTVNINGKEIPKCIYYRWDISRLYLLLATEEYLYYTNGDCTLMLDAETNEVIADNNFAEDGYYQSVINIGKETETMLYIDEESKEDFYKLQAYLLADKEEE